MAESRFHRNVLFFGEEGQKRLAACRCAIVGCGGLGTHVVQQLAYLGVGAITIIDHEELDYSNRNRYIGSRFDDRIPGTRKVDLAERLITAIAPEIEVAKVPKSFITEAGFSACRHADIVFGCLDSEGARLILTELCAAYARTYVDLATEIIPGDPPDYGGRVCFSTDGDCCLSCLDVLDRQEAGQDLGGEAEAANRDAIYGVDPDVLSRSGPSVVSINGVVASLAVTEFMAFVTRLRSPNRLLNYNARTGKVTTSLDTPLPDCWYCKGLWGQREKADVENHFRSRLGERL